MEENKKVDSSEVRKQLHEIVEGLADLADQGNDTAIMLLLDFNQFGSVVMATKGNITVDQLAAMMAEMAEECGDPECQEHHAATSN